jgi:hypothetical protein
MSPRCVPQGGQWKVELRGDRFDLELLKEALGPSGSVECEGAKWFLTSPQFHGSMAARDVLDAANRLLRGPVALLTVESPDFKPVEAGEAVFERPDGRPCYVLVAEPGAIRVQGGRSRLRAPVARDVRLYELYGMNPEVERAVDFFNRPDETFTSLNNAYEIVRDDLGGGQRGRNKAARLAGVDPQDIMIFEENAHNPRLSGQRARHANPKQAQPSWARPMKFEEARELIRSLLLAWMASKL